MRNSTVRFNNFTEIILKLKSQFIDVLLLNLPKLDVMFLAVKTLRF